MKEGLIPRLKETPDVNPERKLGYPNVRVKPAPVVYWDDAATSLLGIMDTVRMSQWVMEE